MLTHIPPMMDHTIKMHLIIWASRNFGLNTLKPQLYVEYYIMIQSLKTAKKSLLKKKKQQISGESTLLHNNSRSSIVVVIHNKLVQSKPIQEGVISNHGRE